MKYFESFNKIEYIDHTVTNITKRFDVVHSVVDTEGSTFQYNIKHRQLPEDIAYNFYGDSGLHWLILMTNKINDPFYGWYLDYDELLEYTNNSYDDINATHHYEYEDAVYKDLPHVNATIVTNLEYEERLNENRRTIKVIYPSYLNQIISEFKDVVSG